MTTLAIGEARTVQFPMVKHAGAIGWTVVPPEDAEATKLLTTIAAATSPGTALAAFASSGPRSLIDLLPKITTPTRIIAGTDDKICLPQASEFLAERIPGSKHAVASRLRPDCSNVLPQL